MKKTLIIIIFFITQQGFSQSYFDEIVDKACDCLGNIDSNLDKEQINTAGDLCIVDECKPYRKELKKDYGLDMDDFDETNDKFSETLGIKMSTKCPKVLFRFIAASSQEESAKEEVVVEIGTITSSEKDAFIYFNLKNEAGKPSKLYWLDFIQSDLDMINNYLSLLGKKVEISYVNKELFDPKSSEYRSFKVIKKIVLLKS
jgi:hypothetical protein